jgi:hypothetical protein
MLLIILVVLLLLTLGGGGWGHSRYGYASWSPAGLILLVLVVLWFTGHLLVPKRPLDEERSPSTAGPGDAASVSPQGV